MADVVLFHHILGLTPGVESIASRIRAAGHTVLTPDLFGGRSFDSIDAGMEYLDGVGFDTFLSRADVALDSAAPDPVVMGISLGAMPAQRAAQQRTGVRGAVLFESAAPASTFGAWPSAMPVQIHGMDADPFFALEGDIDSARAIVASADDGVAAELHVYPGDRHLFVDASLASFDAEAASTALDRTLRFLAEIAAQN